MSVTDTAEATITVLAVTPITGGGRLLALADAELLLGGVAVVIHGIQLRADGNGTEVALPKYRAQDGSWRAAIALPDEAKGPMGDAVIEAGIEAGVLRQR